MLPALGDIDIQSTVTGLVVFAGAIGAVAAGIRQGLKKIRAGDADAGVRLAGGVLMDNTSMMLMSERLRENADVMRDNTAAVNHAAHQIERLRDKMS